MAKTPKEWSDVPNFINEFIKETKDKLDSMKSPELKKTEKENNSDSEKDKSENIKGE